MSEQRALPIRVLVVDDREADFRAIERLLREQDGVSEVHWAKSADEGLEDAPGFDACLVDQTMNGEDSLSLVEKFRQTQPEMAVIAVTSNDSVELDSAALRAGAHAFLCKENFTGLELNRALRYSVEQALRCAELSKLARQDSVTGLHNRVSIMEQLNVVKARALAANGQPFAVCLVDLDDFKGVNDAFGHAAGDRVLLEVGARLRSELRPGDSVGRLGGDEFLIILGEVAGPTDALRIAGRLHESLLEISQPNYPATRSSFGLAMYPSHGEDIESLLEAADQAMYRAKRSGKGRVQLHSLEGSTYPYLESSTRRDLCDGLSLVFQPQLSLDTHRVVGFEALSRYQSGHSIAELVKDLKEVDRILELDRWAVEAAIQKLQVLGTGFKLSVNVSPSSVERGGLVEQLAKKNPSTLKNLEIEITESEPFSNLELASRVLVDIRSMGVRVALDDFGMAHSSLERLQALPVDTIKLGHSITTLVGTNHRASVIAASVTQLARRLNVDVVAEGIESRAVVEKLESFGVQFGQGYYFARPMQADELGPWISRMAESA